jgi:hypothetical protein
MILIEPMYRYCILIWYICVFSVSNVSNATVFLTRKSDRKKLSTMIKMAKQSSSGLMSSQQITTKPSEMPTSYPTYILQKGKGGPSPKDNPKGGGGNGEKGGPKGGPKGSPKGPKGGPVPPNGGTWEPTSLPSSEPSSGPSSKPSRQPTSQPSRQPTGINCIFLYSLIYNCYDLAMSI